MMSRHPNHHIPVMLLPEDQRLKVERTLKRMKKRKDRKDYNQFINRHECEMNYTDCNLRGFCNGDC